MIRCTSARVDLDALASNFRSIRAHLEAEASLNRTAGGGPPRAPGIIAVVKANAYGHGAAPVGLALEAEGAAAGIAKLLRTAGATMARTAPSTMGTLTATGFLRASKAVEDKDALDTAAMAAFWRAYRDGVAERGKAKVGDKTLLDVLDPIAVTLEAQASTSASLADALNVTAGAAEAALEATKSMLAQHGKAAAFQEKTVGLQDAGATVGAFLIRRMADFAASR